MIDNKWLSGQGTLLVGSFKCHPGFIFWWRYTSVDAAAAGEKNWSKKELVDPRYRRRINQTRSHYVEIQEEIDRVVQWSKLFGEILIVWIPEVLRRAAALEVGADIVNDITGFLEILRWLLWLWSMKRAQFMLIQWGSASSVPLSFPSFGFELSFQIKNFNRWLKNRFKTWCGPWPLACGSESSRCPMEGIMLDPGTGRSDQASRTYSY